MFSKMVSSNTKYLGRFLGNNVFNKFKVQKISPKFALGAGLVTGVCVAGQTYYGSTENFYDHRFITNANPDDLAEFYGNEDFMEIFCVFPFVVDFMMRSGHFDEQGHVHTFGLPPLITKMVVSMQFDEREEDEITVSFNKKERFECTDKLFGFTVWEMVQNFGYSQRDDGTSEIYHYGQKWYGPFFIRFIFELHARYVIYATEQHINSDYFLEKKEDDEDKLIAQRHNIPLHLVNKFLDRLENHIKDKLNKSYKNLIAKEDPNIEELKQKVDELERLILELKTAKNRRTQTLDFKRKETTNKLQRESTVYDGSARSLYTRSLMKRVTMVNKFESERLSNTITNALKHIENEDELKKKFEDNLELIEKK